MTQRKNHFTKGIDMKKSLLILAGASALLLSSCASKFSADQKASLTSFSVPKPAISNSAYVAPIGNSDFNTSANSGGAIGVLLGAAIDAGIKASQRSGFNSKYGSAAAQAKTSIPSDLNEIVQSKTAYYVNTIPELNGKLSNSSKNSLITNVTAYGYKRTGKQDGKILMTPYINASVSMYLNGEQAFKPVLVNGDAYPMNGGGHEITSYTSDKSLAINDFRAAADSLANKIKTVIANKF